MGLYNPEKFKKLGASRLDLGQVLNEEMTDECYQELLVSPLQYYDTHIAPLLQ